MAETKSQPDPSALLAALEASLDAGDLGAARQADIALRENLRGARLSKGRERRLAASHRRLHELREWQHWANNKQRHRLCKNVESLPDSGLHPDALLQALREAQTEWKHLEESEKLAGERGAYRASGQGLWRRFRAACNRAFNQARPFLEKRTELRGQNLEAVRGLIQRLEKELASEQPTEIPVVVREIGQARQVLSRLDELPPRQRGSIAKRLRVIVQQLKDRLRQQEEKVVQAKRALIAEAEALQDEPDRDKAIQSAKRINQRWKHLGNLLSANERKLWAELRGHLDPLFEQHRVAKTEQRAAREADLDQLRKLCEQAERIAQRQGTELEDAGKELKALQGQWRGVKVQDRGLRERFKKAQDDYRQRMAEHQAQRRFGEVRELFENAVQRQLANGSEADESWLEQNRLQAEEICVELELIAEVDSPKEAQAARMELKVRRLNDALRGERPNQDSEEAMQSLLARWAGIEALSGKVAKHTQARVKHSIEAFYGLPLNDKNLTRSREGAKGR